MEGLFYEGVVKEIQAPDVYVIIYFSCIKVSNYFILSYAIVIYFCKLYILIWQMVIISFHMSYSQINSYYFKKLRYTFVNFNKAFVNYCSFDNLYLIMNWWLPWWCWWWYSGECLLYDKDKMAAMAGEGHISPRLKWPKYHRLRRQSQAVRPVCGLRDCIAY